MMKSAVLGVVLLNFILLLACTRVQVEILQPAGETEKRTPDPGKVIDKITEKVLDQDRTKPAGPKPCATDRNVTLAVAQETDVWCWAASGQGVMSFHNVKPRQCGIVNKAKVEGNATGEDSTTPICCENNFVAQCQQNGWPDEVFDKFGIDYRWLYGTLSQPQVAEQICENGPFTYSIEYEGGGGHTFVVKDYWMDGPEEMSLWVDSHEYFTDEHRKRHPAGFKELSYKEYEKGSYDGTSKVDFTYIQIKPRD